MTETGEEDTLELLRAWHQGSQEALEQLLQRNVEWLREHVRHRVGPRLRAHEETQDYVQEALIDVLTHGPKFEVANQQHFRALLARVVENNLRDKDRWLRRHCRDGGREGGAATDTVLRLDPAVRSVTRPSQVSERQEREAWIRLAIELLDPREREVLWLREWEDLSFVAIGERLSLTENAARMRYRHALPKLARKVRDLRGGRIDDAMR